MQIYCKLKIYQGLHDFIATIKTFTMDSSMLVFLWNATFTKVSWTLALTGLCNTLFKYFILLYYIISCHAKKA